MPTRLLLVRHAESEWNAAGRVQGQADPPLSEHGRRQGAAAASRVDVDVIVSSDLRRARETADIIASAAGLDVWFDPALREIDVGEFAGLTRNELLERFPDEAAAWREGRLERFPGGESRQEHRERLLAAAERLADAFAGRRVLVVTHGGAIHNLERHLDVYPGVGVGHLEGRWFEAASELRAVSDRVSLLEDGQPS